MGWSTIDWLVGLGVEMLPELSRIRCSELATVLQDNSHQGVEIAAVAMEIGQKKEYGQGSGP